VEARWYQVIPDEAVEAAMKSIHETRGRGSFEDSIWLALTAAAPHMMADAFNYGWREGAGIPSPVNLDTGELMPDQAMQPDWNPHKEEV
jgi:hypothetical protein